MFIFQPAHEMPVQPMIHAFEFLCLHFSRYSYRSATLPNMYNRCKQNSRTSYTWDRFQEFDSFSKCFLCDNRTVWNLFGLQYCTVRPIHIPTCQIKLPTVCCEFGSLEISFALFLIPLLLSSLLPLFFPSVKKRNVAKITLIKPRHFHRCFFPTGASIFLFREFTHFMLVVIFGEKKISTLSMTFIHTFPTTQ